MFMMPRSLARVSASGSTWVTSAWSTDRKAPYPAPRKAPATSVVPKLGQITSSTAAMPCSTDATATNIRRRPDRSDSTPPP